MDSHDLKIFAETYQNSSFSQAASHLFMTPQGLAKKISRLESELGVTLFQRSKTGIQPTPYADALFGKVNELDSILNEISTLKFHTGLQRKTVSLYSTYGILRTLGLSFFHPFMEKNPDITLNLIEFPDSALEQHFKEGSIHLGFVTEHVNFENYNSYYFTTQKYCALVSEDHPLASKDTAALGDFSDFPQAVRGREYNIFRKNTNNFLKNNLYPNIFLETSEDALLLDFAATKNGVSFILEESLKYPETQSMLKTRGLKALAIEDDNFARDVYFIESKNAALSQGETLLGNYIKGFLIR